MRAPWGDTCGRAMEYDRARTSLQGSGGGRELESCLAAAQHHSAPKCAGPETHAAPRGQTTARAAAGVQHFCLVLDEAPAAGCSPPDRLSEVRPQERVQRHTADQFVAAPLLDVPVPLMEEQAVDASALAFLEEAEEKALDVENLELARTAASHDSVERLREVVRRMDVLRQKGRGRKKKRMKRRLARSPRPRLVSGCCLRSTRARPRLLRTAWFYSGYTFLPRSRRVFGTNSTLFLRESGACAVRTWRLGLSTHPRYLARTCLVSLVPEEHR